MFLLGNSLPYKNKDVSLIPRIHIKKKKSVVSHAYDIISRHVESQDRVLGESQTSETPCHKQKHEQSLRHDRLFSGLNINAYTCITHATAHKTTHKKEKI